MANRARGRRSDYEWEAVQFDSQTLDLAVGTKVQLVTVTAAGPVTLVRTRGEVFAELDTSGVNERAIICVGGIVVGEVAAAAGIASLPGPFTQGSDDWFWHGYLTVSSGQESGVAQNSLFDRLVVDSKAMRKLKSDEVLVFMAEIAGSSDQGGHATVMGGLRVLEAS